jgi:ubiquinol-cytochrome c reductase cytochrome b subunit
VSGLAKLDAWLDERVGHKEILKVILDEPVVGGARWAYIFGSALTLVFAVQAVTGILLMTTYAPSAATAWASVHYLTNRMSGGWLVRGLHHFGSQAMVVLLGLHIFQVATYGAYKRPREMNWWLGLGLMGITLGFALTGYLLPWDQKGYWATQVATNIAGTSPGIGTELQTLLQGGGEYGSLTLTRFYSLHVAVLPLSLLIVLAGHVFLFRRHGVTPPASADKSVVARFYPQQVAKDLAAALLVLAVIFWFAYREHGAPLDAPADAASDYPARPEWYFLSLFQLLKYLPGKLEMVGSLGIPFVAGAYLVALPLLDRAPTNALRPRLKWVAPLYAGMAGVGVLTWLSLHSDAGDTKFQEARKEADERARIAIALAMKGIPPDGPLAMMKNDPELRGKALFTKHCATCHVLGNLGDPKKATAPTLDGWGTEAWILQTMHDPDADTRFGKTPYAGEMPSMDTPPKDAKQAESFKPMSPADMKAAATFLAAQGDEPGEPVTRDESLRKAGEAVVKERCTTCHLFNGEGDDIGEELAPEFAGYGSLAWTASQIRDPSTPKTYRAKALEPGRKGHMPKFSEELPAADIELLARWVRQRTRFAQ